VKIRIELMITDKVPSVSNDNVVATLNKDDNREKVISVLIENFADKSINITGIDEDDRSKKREINRKAAEMFIGLVGEAKVIDTMLATQMTAVHDLQQQLFSRALLTLSSPIQNQYYVNALTKLSNVFVQQVTLLQKLQGKNQHRVTVEHVHVHNGGQAVVGVISGSIPTGDMKK
jgi:hypothetical protein